ncbi:MAG: hypothetical protein A3G81_13785 [Betaproteobacteria bacterium RIFCSPLOWO2_12_FULL_65_14]|nr:MAG: hypothetical protein A3G81_13785 [Betaproteobacteria bacterium RIFCSPLOWO2_12_FULL_65_14]
MLVQTARVVNAGIILQVVARDAIRTHRLALIHDVEENPRVPAPLRDRSRRADGRKIVCGQLYAVRMLLRFLIGTFLHDSSPRVSN